MDSNDVLHVLADRKRRSAGDGFSRFLIYPLHSQVFSLAGPLSLLPAG
jgi:hypothetical protein